MCAFDFWSVCVCFCACLCIEYVGPCLMSMYVCICFLCLHVYLCFFVFVPVCLCVCVYELYYNAHVPVFPCLCLYLCVFFLSEIPLRSHSAPLGSTPNDIKGCRRGRDHQCLQLPKSWQIKKLSQTFFSFKFYLILTRTGHLPLAVSYVMLYTLQYILWIIKNCSHISVWTPVLFWQTY